MGAAVCSFSSMGRGFLKMGAPLIPESQCKILIAADLGNHQSSPGQNEAFFSILGISMSRVTIINEQLKSLPIKKKMPPQPGYVQDFLVLLGKLERTSVD